MSDVPIRFDYAGSRRIGRKFMEIAQELYEVRKELDIAMSACTSANHKAFTIDADGLDSIADDTHRAYLACKATRDVAQRCAGIAYSHAKAIEEAGPGQIGGE